MLTSSKFGDEQVLKESFVEGELEAAWFSSCVYADETPAGSSCSCDPDSFGEDEHGGPDAKRLDLSLVAQQISKRMCLIQLTSGVFELMLSEMA